MLLLGPKQPRPYSKRGRTGGRRPDGARVARLCQRQEGRRACLGQAVTLPRTCVHFTTQADGARLALHILRPAAGRRTHDTSLLDTMPAS